MGIGKRLIRETGMGGWPKNILHLHAKNFAGFKSFAIVRTVVKLFNSSTQYPEFRPLGAR